MQNRFLWQRYQHCKSLMASHGIPANESWGWHGSGKHSPSLLYEGEHGVDFRKVG